MVWVFKLFFPLKTTTATTNNKRLEQYIKTYPLGLNYLIVSFTLSHGESIQNSALGRKDSRHLQAR